MKTIFLFLIIFAYSINSNAQSTIDIYGDFIPHKIISNSQFREQIKSNLDFYAQLNPDLIYYYLQYLDYRFERDIIDPDSNYFNLLRHFSNIFKEERNKWLTKEMDRAEKEIDLRIESSRVKSYIDILYSGDVIKQDINKELVIDRNLQCYYSYIFLQGQKDSGYDPSKDYCDRERAVIDQIRGEIKSNYSDNKNSNFNRDEILNNALQHPYLFADSYVEKFNNSFDIHLFQYIDKFIHEDYNQHIQIGLSMMYHFANLTVEERFPSSNTPWPYWVIKEDIRINSYSAICFGGKIKIPLSNNKGLFSSISTTFSFGLLPFASDKGNLPNELYRDMIYPAGSKIFKGTIYISDLQIDKNSFFLADIRTPVYYVTNQFYVSVGLGARYIDVKYHYNLTNEAERFESQDPNDFVDVYTYEVSKNEFKIYPLISFNFDLTKMISFRADYIAPIYASAGIDLQFNL